MFHEQVSAELEGYDLTFVERGFKVIYLIVSVDLGRNVIFCMQEFCCVWACCTYLSLCLTNMGPFWSCMRP